jgi:hypothetical protein
MSLEPQAKIPLKRRTLSLGAIDSMRDQELAPSNDIEDRFASAVKSALDASKAVRPPSEAASESVQEDRPKRSRIRGIVLCLAFAAIAAVVAAASLHVRRSSAARFAGEIAAMWPVGAASNQPNATVVAPKSTAAPESAAAASSLTTMTPAEAAVAAVSPSTSATPSEFAASSSNPSTAAADGVKPTAEVATAAALAAPVEASSTPASASTASITSELQEPLATPSVPPPRTQASRQARRHAGPSRQSSTSAQTDHRAIAAAAAAAPDPTSKRRSQRRIDV